MEGPLYFDLDLNHKFSNNQFVIKKRQIFNFFYCTRYTTRTGDKFAIQSLKFQKANYSIDSIDAADNLSLSFFTPKNDDRPFVLCLEKPNNKTVYYGLADKKDFKWREIDVQGVSNDLDDDALLTILKNRYVQYFASVINLSAHAIFNLTCEYGDVKYTLVHNFLYEMYDKYHFKPNRAHSIKAIRLDGLELSFDKDLRFVQDLYIYYANYDLTTPLLIETVGFRMGDKIPLVNYFTAFKPGSYTWVDVYSDLTLTYPKCEGDIGRILLSEINKYRNYPVELNLKLQKHANVDHIVDRFSDIPFYFGCMSNSRYGYNMYYPRAGSTFLVESLVINDQFQDIEIQSREYRSVFIYYLTDREKAILICFGLRDDSYSPLHFIWYKLEDSIENKWERIDFSANPENEYELIENQIDGLFGTHINVKILMYKTLAATLFTFGTVVGVYIGVKYSDRMSASFERLYNFTRRFRKQDFSNKRCKNKLQLINS
ncbi:conserved hypothetical protein [Theileria orientalis strain Shintoku]|uniref:Uncharacterized protein n=1 Tax=Theileria orientalis strain Shintoku TaxID=869250 RepID=J4C3R0_THEOR|nr:conserved hypothetical protein [Theileria orientalis strain Shintoku]BAM40876.1 conserved hypothetical protein [Theileria orientalis strain Shintoku]|eukprot:XP_009691177.1 conserved hypothetical protein [Theileria orientalis strain Shintoku]